jgi:outer membrane murein-binding lipoprotein Lpp
MNLIPTLFAVVIFSLVPFAWSAQVQVVPTPVPYASVSELNGIIGQLEQASEATQADLSKLKIEKWKTDSGTKKQTLGNVDSIKRNLQGALPEIVSQLRNSPEDLSASFKIYRNLDALYDVLGTVTESAGAFGSKDEFQSLSNDLSALERIRHSFATRMENLTASKEAELNQLRSQVKTLQAAVPPPPPKKIVVDDNEPKKPAPKKKTIPKPPTKQSATPAQPTQQAPQPK